MMPCRWFNDAVEGNVAEEPNQMSIASVDAEGRPSIRMVLLKGYDERGFIFYTNYNSRKGQQLQQNGFAAMCMYWEPLQRSVRHNFHLQKLAASSCPSSIWVSKLPKFRHSHCLILHELQPCKRSIAGGNFLAAHIDRTCPLFSSGAHHLQGLEHTHTHTSGSSSRGNKCGLQIRVEGTVEKLSEEESTSYFHSRPRSSQVGAIVSPQSQVVKGGRKEIEDRAAELKAVSPIDPTLSTQDSQCSIFIYPSNSRQHWSRKIQYEADSRLPQAMRNNCF